MNSRAPHPVTGGLFDSPVVPGTGWPGDPATGATPVAHTGAQVAELAAATESVADLQAAISVCRACPRLVRWRESVAIDGRRAAFADQPYWGRPGPSFGPADASVLLVGLAPAANGTNRTGRMFTGDASGDFLWAALYRTGWAMQETSVAAGDGQGLHDMRMVAAVRCAPPQNRPTGQEKVVCRQWLERDLELAADHLRAILCLGALSWQAIWAAAKGLGWTSGGPMPTFGHGACVTLSLPHGRQVHVVGGYHVSPHNTYTGRLTPAMLDELLLELRAQPRDEIC